jgi:glyoxylase-like metal-dependent hydrolase (beta-lactamase superfamily II)
MSGARSTRATWSAPRDGRSWSTRAWGPATTALSRVFDSSGRLPAELRAVGVEPEWVDTVLLTHLHPDHVGWNLRTDNGAPRLTFPNARYLVSRADWDAFHRPEVQAHMPFPYVAETITPLEALGALELVDGECHVSDEVTAIPTPGHTPGHMSVVIESEGERAILLVDVVLHPAQVAEPEWNAMFDMDGETARTTRHALLDQVEAAGTIVAASHFPAPGFGRVTRVDGRRSWQPL